MGVSQLLHMRKTRLHPGRNPLTLGWEKVCLGSSWLLRLDAAVAFAMERNFHRLGERPRCARRPTTRLGSQRPACRTFAPARVETPLSSSA